MQYHHKTLHNGMKAVVIPDNQTPFVHIATVFKTGAKDEQFHEWGCAHLCEHLFFTGTQKAPYFDKSLTEFGGSSNAWTEHDGTVFLSKGPKSLFERILWLESDRFQNLPSEIKAQSWETERNVVVNELLETVEDTPFGKLLNESWGALYGKKHPYGHSVIGTLEHIRKLNLPEIQSFLNKHYSMSNATIVVIGDFQATKAFELIEQYFDMMPQKPAVKTTFPNVKRPFTEHIHSSEEHSHHLLRWEWIIPPSLEQQEDSFSALCELLTSQRLGMLYHQLQLKQNSAHYMDSGIDSLRHSRIFWIEMHTHNKENAICLQKTLPSLLQQPLNLKWLVLLEKRLWKNRLLSIETPDLRLESICSLLLRDLSFPTICKRLNEKPILTHQALKKAHELLVTTKPLVIWGEGQ
ncbi:MAG: hypothetical protein CMK59_05170 [Proteobacteria bacterium]|nr:hypothetical protein [Pseudomonadota bacterium]